MYSTDKPATKCLLTSHLPSYFSQLLYCQTMNKPNEKRAFKTMYRISWEKNPMLKEWIQSVPGKPDKAYCRYCQRLLYAHRYSVLKHTCTTKHQQNADRFKAKQLNLSNPCPESSEVILIESSQIVSEQIAAEDDEVSVGGAKELVVSSIKPERGSAVKDLGAKDILTFISEGNQGDPCDDILKDETDMIGENNEDELKYETYDFEVTVEESSQSSSSGIEMLAQKNLSISTHILDTSCGVAAANVPVTLFKLENNEWKQYNQSLTNNDGRVPTLLPNDDFSTGMYKLHFNTVEYFRRTTTKFLYPFVEIAFNCDELNHYHIPLLLNPFGYSTYRGT